MNTKQTKWEPTCKRFVAYMDIMGFRDMVFRNTHQKVLEVMEQFRLPIKKLKEEAKERLAGRPHGWDTFENTVVKPVIFSDSVLLFSSDDSLGAVENLIWQVKSIISDALINGIPMKGALAYGKQTAHFGKSLYFGKPLIDAWELQNELVIYGVVLHHTIEGYLAKKEWIEELEETSILKYAVPLKQGTVSHYLVDWSNLPMKASKLKNSLPNLYGKVSGSARQYVDSTMSFVDWREKEGGRF
jgi:hypothetical protein